VARMIPSFCPSAAPPGEQAVFHALAKAPDTDDWVVLHSLWLAEHVRQVEGEADFVVIVPSRGVLVIEVKSHQKLEILSDGRWKLGNDAPTSRGPLQQAREALFSIRDYLTNKKVDLRSIPMLSCAWFSELRARTMLPDSPEWHDWQILDSEDLKGNVCSVILRTIAAGTEHLNEKIKYFTFGGVGPDTATVDRLTSLLRPRVEVHVVPGDIRRARDVQLIRFIEEQYQALDAMADNHQVLYSGPAGSGKTLLALEAAQRETAQAKTGRLLCFNRLLGKRLAADIGETPGLRVGSFHQELLHFARVTVPREPSSDFWERELPERAIEALLEGGPELVADFLIVDEIQDLARAQYLDVLDLMVDGGLERGRLLMFGDFERQAIFDDSDGRIALRERSPHLVTSRLTSNCRNLPRIGYVVNMFSKLDPGYVFFRRQDDGTDPTFLPYPAGEDQSAQVIEAVSRLRGEGYELHEIVILSPLRIGSTAETTTDSWLRQVLVPADGGRPRKGELQHCTIQAYKGLEAPAVVVTDLDRSTLPNFESLLYIGLTRATDRLFAVIESGSLRASLGGKR
jgi:hypothetical protein